MKDAIKFNNILQDRYLHGNLKQTSSEQYQLLAPVPNPPTVRDAYAFRQHVETARKNRGLEMIPEFDQFPVFYFTNPRNTFGPGEIYVMPDHLKELDFELEVAAI